MILNNSKLLILAAAIVLGGCSSFPSLPSLSSDNVENEQATDTNAERQQAQGSATDTPMVEGIENTEGVNNETTVTTIALTPEEIEEQALATKARNLMGTLNAYKLDKEQQRKLSSSQLRDVQNAMNRLTNGEADKALAEIQRVLVDPDFIAAPNSTVWVLRGDIHRALKENDKAKSDYVAALEVTMSNYQAHNRLGFVYRDEGNFDLAKKHYDQAINAWPGYAGSYRNRGILFDLYLGDKKAALEDYQIYKALLDFQIQSVETPAKALLKEQKLARQWILDIQRQIKVLQREQANG